MYLQCTCRVHWPLPPVNGRRIGREKRADIKGKVVIEKRNGKGDATRGKRRKEITDDGRYRKSIELEAKCVVDGREVPEEERHEGNAR